jgi:hypothetical protein
VGSLKTPDRIVHDDEGRASIFSDRLRDTFSDTNEAKFDANFKTSVDDYINCYKFGTGGFNVPFSIGELNAIFDKLKLHTAMGIDGIHNRMLKETHHPFRLLLLNLVNRTVSEQQVPSAWKSASITMIPKKANNSSDPKDYRPISLTSNMAKLAERLILSRLQSFLKENNIIKNQQSGFRSHRQTRDNLLFLSQKVSESLIRKKNVCCVFFDIAAAFDKVWHNGLLFKLIKINTPDFIITWIKEFLSNRSFSVKINNYSSEPHPISTGVPQGAVLSPVLFSIFINDIPLQHSKNRKYSLLFADDLVSFFIFKKRGKIQNEIQRYLTLVEKWLITWRLMMAPNKCSHNTFSKSPFNESPKIVLKLFNQSIPVVNEPKFLGITFDSRFTFKNHIENLHASCIKRLNVVKILSSRSWRLSSETLINIYKSLVRSIIEYSSIIIENAARSNFQKLNVIQNNAIRAIFKQPHRSHQETLLDLANLPSISQRFQDLNNNYLTKCIQFENPLVMDLIQDFLTFNNRGEGISTPLSGYKQLIEQLAGNKL